jgi:acyl-[acyl-carrier-protein]-phospholipid O-acyltransferase/long-chain-fatty-acid--[acyl-carrier-protein] ligase
MDRRRRTDCMSRSKAKAAARFADETPPRAGATAPLAGTPSIAGPEPPPLGGPLWTTGFVGLLATQFLGAVNDNIFRWLVIGIGKEMVPPESVSYVLMGGTACFVLPFLLLAAPAGYLADRYSKRTVLVGCKAAEGAIMALALIAILTQSLAFLFVTLAFMGAQSALFGPARSGSIPEMLPIDKISAANGVLGLLTVSATVIGMAVGNVLVDWTHPRGLGNLWITAGVLLGVAASGWLASLSIARLAAADPSREFPWRAAAQTVRDLRLLAARPAILRVALGIMFFWALGALAQVNIDQFAAEGGAWRQSQVVPLLLALVFGLGLGSVLAGVWSGGRVELGLLPLGAAGISLGAMLLFTVEGALVDPGAAWTAAFIWACVFLFILGVSAGLFSVPLDAYMQRYSDPKSRGSILAASNFLTFAGILAASLLFAVLRFPLWPSAEGGAAEPFLSARGVFLLCGVCTLPVLAYITWLIPQTVIRFFVWLASKTMYRIRIYGRANLPVQGPAVLVANHISWIDGFLLLLASSRPIRMLAWVGNFPHPAIRWFAEFCGMILLGSRPKELARSLKTARQALENGEIVCLFPEGGISRTGQIQAFRPGVMKIVEGLDVPIIPVYLDELWGSIFSFKGGKFFWKLPRRWPYPISVHIGEPVAGAEDVHRVRLAVQELGAKAVEQRSERMPLLSRSFIRSCKRRLRASKAADSTGADLSGGELLMRTLILRRLLRRHVLASDERYVGVLLPPSAGGVTANMALALDRRVAVNLNYTVSAETQNQCLAQCGIRHVLTSRKFMEKLDYQLKAQLVYLDDFKDRVTTADKALCAAAAYAVPASLLEWSLGLHHVSADELLTVIFTSGSTGTPKGVMLSYANVGSNVEAIDQVIQLKPSDVLVGILPFFHSFGYTVTMWAVMALDVKGVYHYSPLEPRQIGKLCREHGGTILLATPTFLRTYTRRCEKEDFATLDVVVAGAEKLPRELADAFDEKFGVRPVEGYGATELSPLVSVNVPRSRSSGNFQEDNREGSVGRPVPGVSAKVVDLETGRDLKAGESGMLLIRGPNVMMGYLGREDLTSEVIRDGWYVTGDVSKIDDEGFIHITGRESRFSKIGGEMVPHLQIEETLAKILGGQEEGLKAAVVAVPDAKKGERLIVIHTSVDRTPDELCKALAEEGLPNLYIPGADSFHQVETLPVLGSGKLDLKAVRQIALERFGPQQQPAE